MPRPNRPDSAIRPCQAAHPAPSIPRRKNRHPYLSRNGFLAGGESLQQSAVDSWRGPSEPGSPRSDAGEKRLIVAGQAAQQTIVAPRQQHSADAGHDQQDLAAEV